MGDTASLPTGTVTFLFTDIEGSTRLWEQHPDAMRLALARHDALATTVIEQHAGILVKSRGEGDSLFAAFARATDGVAAACALQRAFRSEPWPAETPLRARVALHSGEADPRDGDYYGPIVNRCARLRGVGHGEQILLSQATADLVCDALPEAAVLRDLGVHRLKDLQQPEHLFQIVLPSLPSDFPPLRSLEWFAHNLPRQLTSFVGREQEMTEVKRLLTSTALLTLMGSGGRGKTRLALQVAADLLEEYPDGVWLVELAPLADPSLVPQFVASALGVREEPGKPLTRTLMEALQPKKLLLLLDNCEHVLDACAALAETLLRHCPIAQLLATSGEGLNISGETPYRLRSLAAPDPHRLPATLEGLAEYEAVRLFLDRAMTVAPSFALTTQNAAAVVQVCKRLDGIPLAIELAAARVQALPVETLNERLDDRFRLLTGGSRTALPRQQTLRALIDWSHDLLSEPEKALFRRLSVFVGGWTLEAAEAVCCDGVGSWQLAVGSPTDPTVPLPTANCQLPTDAVLDLLTSLVDKSLVLYEEQEYGGRYRLLETVRQYARDRLTEAGELASARRQHRDWFLALAEQAEPKLVEPEQKEWLDRLEREHDNLRAALAWSGAQGQGELALRLGGSLSRFWLVRGYWTEAREHLAGLLALPGAEARTAARAWALCGAGRLAESQADWEAARALQEESLAISRELGDKRGIAFSLMGLGLLADIQGDVQGAEALHEESLAIFRELGAKWGIAASLSNLGRVAYHQGDYRAERAFYEESLAVRRELGDKRGIAVSLAALGHLAYVEGDLARARVLDEESLAIRRELKDKQGIAGSLNSLGLVARLQGECEQARTFHEEGLAIERELGNRRGMAFALTNLGCVAYSQGKYEEARTLQEESLAISRELGIRGLIAYPLVHLGVLACLRGEYEEARAFYQESLAIVRGRGDKTGIARGLERLAVVAVAQGQSERAARLLGAAEALREAMGAPLHPADRAEHNHSIAAARTALGEEAYEAAWAEGRAMTPEQAITYSLEEPSPGEAE